MASKELSRNGKLKRNGIIYLAGLVVFFFVLETTGIINFIESPAQNIFLPLEIASRKTKNDLDNFVETVSQIKSLKQKESSLSYENALLEAENARLQKLEAENKTLRQQLGATEIAEEFIVAKVIGGGPLISGNDLLIDKGRNNSVPKGGLVVVKNILIGQVSSVGEVTSRVRLLSDPETKIPAETESKVSGLLVGQFGNQVVLDRVVQGRQVGKGEIVFTSGQSDMPKGLILGRVKRVESDPADLFQRAILEPILPYSSLETVFVIKKK